MKGVHQMMNKTFLAAQAQALGDGHAGGGLQEERERQEEGRISPNNDVRSDLEELRSTQAVRDWF